MLALARVSGERKVVDEEDYLVPVSPRHAVRVGAEYAAFIKKAPRQDFVVRTIMKREANGMPLVSADIVIAGEETRSLFPLAASYPLHFRKTYYPGRLHGDPRQERDRQNEAAEILGIPPAIGATHQTFRSCFLPGSPYNRLSPFGAEPEDANLPLARKLHLAQAAGLWRLLNDAFDALSKLHQHDIAHGDLELHNLIVCPSPLEMILIDFEARRSRALAVCAGCPARSARRDGACASRRSLQAPGTLPRRNRRAVEDRLVSVQAESARKR